jgi:hypothetical protein
MTYENWATHLEFLVLLVTLIGGFYLLDGKIERQAARTDRLYEMFIDLIRDGKK